MLKKIFFIFSLLIISSISFSAPADKEQIRRTIKKNLKSIKTCHEQATAAETNPEGKIVVDFEVDDRGKVVKIKINDEKTTLNELNIQKCLVETVKSWKFPKAAKEKSVVISYPFTFKAK